MYAFEGCNALIKGYLRLSQNPATGDGGACYGGCGGPNFLTVEGTRLIAAKQRYEQDYQTVDSSPHNKFRPYEIHHTGWPET